VIGHELSIAARGDTLTLLAGKVPLKLLKLTQEAIEDIGDNIELGARLFAPEGNTGQLQAHPVDRDKSKAGVVVGSAPLFGGGYAVRGPKGQFFFGGTDVTPGDVFYREIFTVAEKPAHAKWVHNGTGIYGPHKTPIVPRTKPFLVFRPYPERTGAKIVTRSVRGQEPQPFLLNAYRVANRSYVPFRLALLRGEFAAVT
jgi:hypothetical protein